MGLDGIMKMVDEFDLNKRTGVDLPHELVSWTPSREFKARFTPKGGDPTWKDIDTVYASFGQVYDFVTPLAMLRAQAAIANGGRLYVPHLLKEAMPVRPSARSPSARARPSTTPTRSCSTSPPTSTS
jgi:penicillin-binding protein 2